MVPHCSYDKFSRLFTVRFWFPLSTSCSPHYAPVSLPSLLSQPVTCPLSSLASISFNLMFYCPTFSLFSCPFPERSPIHSSGVSQWRSSFLERVSPQSPKLGYYRVWKHTVLLLLPHLYLQWVVWSLSQLSVSLPRCFAHRRCSIDICGRNEYLALIFLSLCSSEEGAWDKHILLLLGSDPKSKTKG